MYGWRVRVSDSGLDGGRLAGWSNPTHPTTKNSTIDKQVIRDILEWGAKALPPLPEEARETYPYFAFLPNLQVVRF